jgi:hypothetical protein
MAGVVPMRVKTSGRKQWTLHGKLFENVFFFVVVKDANNCGVSKKVASV